MQLLSIMPQQQQLTYLALGGSLKGEETNPPAAAYAALTASSKLQHLDISHCCLPADVWQHIFPVGRQLPLLRVLNLECVKHPVATPAAAPTATSVLSGLLQSLLQATAAAVGPWLVSCCPSLQCLDIQGLQFSRGVLASLQVLSSLRSLRLEASHGSPEGVADVCKLTKLQKLVVRQPIDGAESLLPQLVQLRQLTSLRCIGTREGGFTEKSWTFCTEVSFL
jgi:hypothetical protein